MNEHAVSAAVKLARSPSMKKIHVRNIVGHGTSGVNALFASRQ